MIDLDELERLEKAATPGTLRTVTGGDGETTISIMRPPTRGFVPWRPTDEDLELLVAARNALPKLIIELRCLRELKAAALAWTEREVGGDYAKRYHRYWAAISACRAAREGGK